MAPCPMLMTPIRPNTTARPSAASANTKVIRVASTKTLSIMLIGGPLPHPRHGPAQSSLAKPGRRSTNPSGLERKALATRIRWRDCLEVLHLLEHVVDARPAWPHPHQIGRQHHLIVDRAHGDLALGST